MDGSSSSTAGAPLLRLSPASRSGRIPPEALTPRRAAAARESVRGVRCGRRPARGGAGCPNLLQRPGSSRGAGGGSLVFRASSRGRSRSGAPLQQIWTTARPGSSQESHAHHRAGAPATASPDEGGGRPSGAERSPRGAIFPLRTGLQGPRTSLMRRMGRPGLGPPGRFSRARRFPVERAAGRCAFDWKPARSRSRGRPGASPPGRPRAGRGIPADVEGARARAGEGQALLRDRTCLSGTREPMRVTARV